MDVSQFRREYLQDGLSRDKLNPNPVEQFSQWFEQARQTNKSDPTAMVLATVGKDGMPSYNFV